MKQFSVDVFYYVLMSCLERSVLLKSVLNVYFLVSWNELSFILIVYKIFLSWHNGLYHVHAIAVCFPGFADSRRSQPLNGG